MVIFEAVTRKARKQHTCTYCGQFIRRGAHYKQWACVDDGTVMTCRAHMECASVDWDCDDDGIEPGTGWRGVDYDTACDDDHVNADTDVSRALQCVFDDEKQSGLFSGWELFYADENRLWDAYERRDLLRTNLHRFMAWFWELPLPVSALDAGHVITALSDVFWYDPIDTEDATALWELLTGYDPNQPT